MKRFIFPLSLIISALLISCNTTKKLYEAQEYDQVIMKNTPCIYSGHLSAEEIAMVADSYHRANQADHDRIVELKASGKPDIWPEVFERYSSMKGRNELLGNLPNDLKKEINYLRLNVDEDLKVAQNKAEAYLTAKIAQMLSSNDSNPDDIDQLIMRLERVNPKNSQIDDFKTKSLVRQAEFILADVNIRQRHELPRDFEAAVMSFAPGELAKCPATIHFTKVRRTKYGALMDVEITSSLVTPNRDESITFKESKDGLTANVTDHILSKTATVSGRICFLDPKRGRLLLSKPFEVTSSFNYTYSTVDGPQEACSEQTLNNLKQPILPFPTDDSMLIDAAKELNNLISKTLQ